MLQNEEGVSYQDRVAFACHFLDDKKVSMTYTGGRSLDSVHCFVSASSLLNATQPASHHQWLY